MNVRLTLGKNKKVTGKKSIEALFSSKSHAVFQFPFRIAYNKHSKPMPQHCRLLVTVSKKKFPKAVQRNRIKRQLRELFRLNQQPLFDFLVKHQLFIDIAVSYVKTDKLNFTEYEPSFVKCLDKLMNSLEKFD